MTLRSAEAHYRQQAALAALVHRRVGQLWDRVPVSDVNAWRSLAPQALTVILAAQYAAARAAEPYVASALEEQGAGVAAEAVVAASGFAGMANGAVPPEDLMDLPRIRTLEAIGAGLGAAQALTVGRDRAQRYAVSLVQDAGRQADSVATFARPKVGWVRMVNPPCCHRCAVLAGKREASSTAFLRHPRCDCRAVPAAEDSPGDIGTDPYALFRSGQVRGLNKADWRAIEDGADPIQVANARRVRETRGGGYRSTRSKDKMTTTAGRRRGAGPRLTPDGIYAQAGDDRGRALTLLREHGYIS